MTSTTPMMATRVKPRRNAKPDTSETHIDLGWRPPRIRRLAGFRKRPHRRVSRDKTRRSSIRQPFDWVMPRWPNVLVDDSIRIQNSGAGLEFVAKAGIVSGGAALAGNAVKDFFA